MPSYSVNVDFSQFCPPAWESFANCAHFAPFLKKKNTSESFVTYRNISVVAVLNCWQYNVVNFGQMWNFALPWASLIKWRAHPLPGKALTLHSLRLMDNNELLRCWQQLKITLQMAVFFYPLAALQKQEGFWGTKDMFYSTRCCSSRHFFSKHRVSSRTLVEQKKPTHPKNRLQLSNYIGFMRSYYVFFSQDTQGGDGMPGM